MQAEKGIKMEGSSAEYIMWTLGVYFRVKYILARFTKFQASS